MKVKDQESVSSMPEVMGTVVDGPVCWTSITFTNTNLFILTSSFSFCSFSPH